MALSEPIVTVYMLETRADGTIGIGNSYECSVTEAVTMIRQDQATSAIRPRGIVPEEWLEVGVVAEVDSKKRGSAKG